MTVEAVANVGTFFIPDAVPVIFMAGKHPYPGDDSWRNSPYPPHPYQNAPPMRFPAPPVPIVDGPRYLDPSLAYANQLATGIPNAVTSSALSDMAAYDNLAGEQASIPASPCPHGFVSFQDTLLPPQRRCTRIDSSRH
eukprot:GHVU01068062.1.p1 GENE.GHVU01068062.1~~GHVU01068062.1.p1  ORF type:complete len:138 (-),score=2.10 GHVU01068062.1:1092-1505(-)